MVAKKAASAPLSSVQQALAALRKKDDTIQIGLSTTPPEAFSTGNILLDDATSVGGFPKGRVIELFGLSQSGKTTAALMTAAVHQRKVKAGEAEGAILFLDYERSIDRKYCKQLGVDIDDPDTFIYLKPRSLEQGANAFRLLMEQGVLAFAIIDSVAAMVSDKELEAETGKATLADRARALHQFFRQITGKMEESGVSVIMLNHMMEKIDLSPMGQRMAAQGAKKVTTPGGTAVVYYSSMRIKFDQIKQNDRTEYLNPATQEVEKIVTSYLIQATVVKNKVGIPMRIATMHSVFGKGFSQPHSVLQVLTAHKSVKMKTGGHFEFAEHLMPSDGVIPVGKSKVIEKMESDPEWLERLIYAAKMAIESYRAEHQEQIVEEEDEFEGIDPITGEVLEGSDA
jgi:recombination protein RecA